MGRDLSAIIYYGFPISQQFLEDALSLKYDCDDASQYLYKLIEDWKQTDGPQEPGLVLSDSPEFSEYSTKMAEWRKTRGVDIDYAGVEDYDDEHYYLHLPSLDESVDDGESFDLRDIDLSYRRDADVAISDFCKFAGIPYQQPSWHVTAVYM